MICRTEGDTLIALLTCLKWTRNEKVRSFESKRGSKRIKKLEIKKNILWVKKKKKAYFSS